jgi:DNA polymerase-3 subunit delta'
VLDDVREQDLGVSYLRKVVERKLTSPLLFIGEAGVGRRYATIQAVKESFCSGTRQAGCVCYDCSQIEAGTHPDVMILSSVDGKDIGIDAIRGMTQQSMSYPSMAPYRAFILDGADRLTMPAANAFLKVLEEPPRTARFFLLSESSREIIPTIRSRCGLVPFQKLSEALIISVLQRFETDPDKALVYARLGEGSVGRSVQYWAAGRLNLRDKVVRLLEFGLKKDLVSLFQAVDAMESELPLALRFLGQILFDLRMAKQNPALVINTDSLEVLRGISASLDASCWHHLVTGLKRIQGQSRRTHIALPFHVKSMFATIFVGI